MNTKGERADGVNEAVTLHVFETICYFWLLRVLAVAHEGFPCSM